MMIMNYLLFFYFSFVLNIIIAVAIPLIPRSLDVGHRKDLGLIRRAPQNVFDVAEIPNQDNIPLENEATQTSENINPQGIVDTQDTSNSFQEYLVAGSTPKQAPTQRKPAEPTEGDDEVLPTRVFNPHREVDYKVELEHNPEEKQEEMDYFDQLYAQMNKDQKALMHTLKSMNLSPEQLFDAAKKTALAAGGAALVAWLVQNWSVISVGLMFAAI